MNIIIKFQLLLGLIKFDKVIINSDSINLMLIYYYLIYKIKDLLKLILYFILLIFMVLNQGSFFIYLLLLEYFYFYVLWLVFYSIVFNYFSFYLLLLILVLNIFESIMVVLIIIGLLKFYGHDFIYLKFYENFIYNLFDACFFRSKIVVLVGFGFFKILFKFEVWFSLCKLRLIYSGFIKWIFFFFYGGSVYSYLFKFWVKLEFYGDKLKIYYVNSIIFVFKKFNEYIYFLWEFNVTYVSYDYGG